MPQFSLAQVPGFAADIDVDEGQAGVAADLALTDPGLGVAPGQALAVSVSHGRNPGTGGHVLTLVASPMPAVALIGGELLLHELTVTVRFADGAGAVEDLDPGDPDPVEVVGRVTWEGAGAVGFDAPVELDLTVAPVGDGALALSLADGPLALPGPPGSAPLAELDRGEIRVRAVPALGEIVVGISGEASLTAEGTDQAGQLLGMLSGGAGDPEPVGFQLERRLRLGPGGAATGQGVGTTFRLDLDTLVPDLDALGSLPDAIALDIGLPSLGLARSDADDGEGPLPPDWTLSLRGCDLRFPSIEALAGVRLRGDLRFDVPDALVFRPSEGGGVALPPALAWLAELLSWSPSGIALDELADLVVMAPGEMAWEETLLDALPDDFDPAGLRAVIEPALAASGLAVESFFAALFRAIADFGDPQLEAAWGAWFSDLVPAASRRDRLPDLLRGLGALGEVDLRRIVAALLRADLGLDLDDILGDLGGAAASDPTPGMVELWRRFLAGALDGIPRVRLPDLGAALRGVMEASGGPLGAAWGGAGGATGMSAGQFLVSDALAGLALPSAGWLGDLPTFGGLPPSPSGGGGAGASDAWRLLRQAFAREVTPELIGAARGNPLFAVSLFAAALAGVALTNPAPWLALANQDVTDLPDGDPRSVLTLFEPGTSPAPLAGGPPRPDNWNGRYLIVSDIHRDRGPDDDEGPFRFGSIDHFAANRSLYAELLQRVIDEGHILIEAGDCEELWFVKDPDAQPSPAMLMRRIVEANSGGDTAAAPADVYGRLRTLHEQGRYYRLYGNHDSYLREAAVHAELEDALGPIEVHDFLVIPGVKTMSEHSALDAVADAWTGLSSGDWDELARGRLGMNSADYTATKPFVVCHGHQFDFWNCDENRVLGELIANAVGVPGDQAMDPFLDLRGVALEGNPMLEFQDLFAGLPVLNSWLGPSPARALARRIQHRPNRERLLVNGYMYQESMAAFVGNVLMPLGPAVPHDGISGPWETFWSNRGNHICVGHTHNPQSQPYFALDSAFAVAGPLTGVLRGRVQAALGLSDATLARALLKSRYFNSGTCGWHEGVLWGIEIDDHGQARSVMLTAASRGLEYMDWELGPPESTDYAARLAEIAATIGGALRARLPDIAPLRRRLEELLAEITALVVPLEAMGAGQDADAPFAAGSTGGVDVTGGRSVAIDGTGPRADVAEGLERLGAGLLGILGRLQQHLQGTIAATAETFLLDVQVSAATAERLTAVADHLIADHGDIADATNVWYGAAALLVGVDRLPLLRAGTLADDPEPLLAAAVTALLMLPAPGLAAAFGAAGAEDAFLSTAVELVDRRLRIAVTVGPGRPPEV